jgi:hypothetical protein
MHSGPTDKERVRCVVPADDLGDRGQWLFCLLMTQICPGRNEPYFRLTPLGDKYPTFDYLVGLVGSEAYFFLVQVKTTRQGYRKGRGRKRLRVNVNREDVQRMAASPLPTYLVGIDEPREIGYLLSINEPRLAGLGGLPARHRLDCGNLKRLWEEVRTFWASRDMVLTGSYFV